MSEQKLIENYGYVPFWGFQYAILLLEIYMINNYKQVNNFIDKLLDIIFNKDNEYRENIKKIILSIPFVLTVYYDIRYSSFSFKNMGFNPAYNDTIKQILNILGSYAIIHIFAQDTGVKTSLVQVGILQSHLLFIIASIGMAFSITQNRSQSILALIFYYHLKYVIGQNIIE
jgi:hypothetical protein